MQGEEIQPEITDFDDELYYKKSIAIFNILIKLDFKNIKYSLYAIVSLFIIILVVFDVFHYPKIINLYSFKKYVRDCKNFIMYNREKIYNKHPYLSICLSAFNMEKYIKKNLISILNQSFQDFEIIIINDASNDETENIIKRVQLDDDRIKVISHTKNFGVYRSRIESILNTKSNFITLMNPSDMYLNEHLFQELYDINLQYNFDIIEFSVFQQLEGRNKINYPKDDFERHEHKFVKNIIHQQELSNLLFYLPGTKNYSRIICRSISNKMIRKEILIQTNNYIGKKYYHEFIITADDLIMNIVSYQFAKNYTNVNLPGYLYVKKKDSVLQGNEVIKLNKIKALNYLFYIELFYKYIKDFHKDINFLFKEMKGLKDFILKIKDNNMTQYIQIQIKIIELILSEKNLLTDFEKYLQRLLSYIKY